jgi:hypothetical protein
MKLIMENWNKFVNEVEQGEKLVFFDDEPYTEDNQQKGLSAGTGGIFLSLYGRSELARKALEIIKEDTNFIVKIENIPVSSYAPGELASITTKANFLTAMSQLSGMGTDFRPGYVKPERIMAEVLNQIKGKIPASITYNGSTIHELANSSSGAKDGVKGDAQAATNAIVSSGIAKKVEDYEIPKGPSHRVYGLEQEFIQMFPDGIVGIEISDPKMPNWKKDPIQIVYQGHDGKNHYFKFPDGDNYFMVTKK